MTGSFDIRARLRSFGHAFRGLAVLVRSQHNAWIHAVATAVVITSGLVLDVSNGDWRWLVVAIGAVWTAEALNTAVEFLADATSPDFHPLVKHSKDVAAAGVLIAAVAAAVIATLVFVPHV